LICHWRGQYCKFVYKLINETSQHVSGIVTYLDVNKTHKIILPIIGF
jgi:hypothetical protein